MSKNNIHKNIDLIIKRKNMYGDNIEAIAEKWSMRLNYPITPSLVCQMMALMKDTRIDAIKDELNNIKDQHDFLSNKELLKKVEELNISLSDSLIDRDNYIWIGQNYDKYKTL